VSQGKIGVLVYQHNHGCDAWVVLAPEEMNIQTMEKLVELLLIKEYGQVDYDRDTQDYGGLEYHHGIEPGFIEGVDSEWYKLSIEKLGAKELVPCKFCKRDVPAATAHLHEGTYVGEECGCWDERLRTTE